MCGLVTLHAAGMFANVFQRHRTLAALSQEELAERAGLSRRGISEFEPGPRKLRRGYGALPAGA
jgi:transcriptional regulator with XRE-family HTH domain